mmetsp:Transcript_7624/g.22519  ORF Transcript_7624/g.22519 Transcript_7624/m.22519 type:complete len:217 (+) Transcript_7624:2-652(+)
MGQQHAPQPQLHLPIRHLQLHPVVLGGRQRRQQAVLEGEGARAGNAIAEADCQLDCAGCVGRHRHLEHPRLHHGRRHLQLVEHDVQGPSLRLGPRLGQHAAGQQQLGSPRRGVPLRREVVHLEAVLGVFATATSHSAAGARQHIQAAALQRSQMSIPGVQVCAQRCNGPVPWRRCLPRVQHALLQRAEVGLDGQQGPGRTLLGGPHPFAAAHVISR